MWWDFFGKKPAKYSYLWNKPPKNAWVALDLEMTGTNAKSDHVLSVGAVHIDEIEGILHIDSKNALSIICRPPTMPRDDTIIVHGLRPVDVANGVHYADMLEILLPFIASRPVVGFYTHMDMAFLQQLTKKTLGFQLKNSILDVSLIEQTHRQKRSGSDIPVAQKHLNELIDEFSLPRLPIHDAKNDALMTAMVFCCLYGK